MNNESETFQKCRHLAKSVAALCHALRLGDQSPGEFARWLRVYADEAQQLVHPVDVPTARQEKACHAALLSWAKDVRVQDYVEQKKLLLDRKTQWRWIEDDECTGMINGLPTIRGTPRITNGVLVVIETSAGRTFMAHLDWFVKDKKVRTPRAPTEKQIRDAEFIAALRESLMK